MDAVAIRDFDKGAQQSFAVTPDGRALRAVDPISRRARSRLRRSDLSHLSTFPQFFGSDSESAYRQPDRARKLLQITI
jgi:hypothetical protein